MLRRNARLRREYLYRKSLEGKDREEYERKLKIRRALEGQTLYDTLPYQSKFCLPYVPVTKRTHMRPVMLVCRGQAHSDRAAQGRAGIAAQHRARG